jgi:hypothetical protein
MGRAPPSLSSTMPPSPQRPLVLEPDRRQSFRPTPHRRSHHPVEPPSPPPWAPDRRFRCHERWLPWVQFKSGSGGSRPEGKQRGRACGAGAHARMAGEAGDEQWCELSHGDHGGGVGRGWGAMAAVPHSFLTPAEPPPRLWSEPRRPPLSSPAGESALSSQRDLLPRQVSVHPSPPPRSSSPCRIASPTLSFRVAVPMPATSSRATS